MSGTAWSGSNVNYLTDDPVDEYRRDIESCKRVRDLRELLREKWLKLTPDAYDQAKKITQKDWTFCLKNKRVERHALRVVEQAGRIIMPDVMFYINAMAFRFRVPWGCAFIRARELKKIYKRYGCWRLPKKK